MIDFNTREGIDPHDIDNFAGYNDVWVTDLDWIDTADLTSANGDRVWGMKLQVPAAWQPVSAQIVDVWGQTTAVSL